MISLGALIGSYKESPVSVDHEKHRQIGLSIVQVHETPFREAKQKLSSSIHLFP